MLTNYWRNKCLDSARAALNVANTLTAKAHSGDPGGAGTANLISGAVAAVTFGAASAGVITSTSQCTLTISSAVTVTHVSLWDGSNYVGSYDLPNETFGSEGGSLVVPIGQLVVSYL